MLLIGDVGGTKTNLAIYEPKSRLDSPVIEQSLSSKKYPHLIDLIQDFLHSHPYPIERACFGLAGPVLNGVGNITNLNWTIAEADIRTTLQLKVVKFLNDLEAMSYGALVLPPQDLLTLNAGQAVQGGNIAVLAAGTGLGEAFLVWEKNQYRAIATEGGHVDFAPRNEVEMALLRDLLTKYPRVSSERVLSGPGLSNIYQFLKKYRNYQEDARLASRFQLEDPNAVITELALAGQHPICEEALTLFVSLYGAEAGNIALKVMSTGGVFIGGGIAPKILPRLQQGEFMQAFMDKGRLTNVLRQMPVQVILNQKTGLIGAAHYAQEYLK